MEQRGFILIADITGYTAYLNESELEHAQGTLTDLLELLIEHTQRPLIISRLEGDAVISYGLEDGFLSGQTFLETIETTYIDFRKAIELMVLNNSCQCNACANVSFLDLKFFVHFGAFVLQKISEHDELLGTDVNLIHRLLKNSVTEQTGIRAYLLCTDAAVDALGIEPGEPMVRHTETVADLGEVSMWITDMQPAFEAKAAEDRIEFEPSEVLGTFTLDIAVPQPAVWDYLSAPEFRGILVGSDRQEVSDRKAGRIAAGSTYQCYHGKKAYPQVVLEWEPFDRVVIQQSLGGPDSMVVDYQLSPIDAGTRLASTAARPSGEGLRRMMVKTILLVQAPLALRRMKRFRDRIEEDFAQRQVTGPSPQIDPGSIAQTAANAVAGWNSLTTSDSPGRPAASSES